MTTKTMISIEEVLFERAEAFAKALSISRNRLFVLAIEEFIERHENERLLQELNAVYGKERRDVKAYMYRRTRHLKLVDKQWR